MRILKVTQVYHPFLEKGGPALKVKAIAECLERRGHQVTVLTTTYGAAQPSGKFNLNGIEVVYLPALATYRATTFNPGVYEFCRQHLREFDLVHIYGLYDLLGPSVARYCRRWDIPYLVEPLGMFRPIDRAFLLKRLWHALLGKPCLRGAASLLATSEREFQELVVAGFPPSHLLLRYNGLDLNDYRRLPPRDVARAKLGLVPDEPLVLFLGRLIPRKGADLLISAFAQVCPRRGQLLIAGPEGESGYMRSLQALTNSQGVSSRVAFPGPLFGEQKKEVLVAADVFVLASRYENFANSVAEAIACSTPVIVSENCGISPFVENKAGLVILRTQEALTGALRRVLGDAGLRARFRAACPEVAASLAWDQVLVPMLARYEELVQRPASRDKDSAHAGR